jgi:hypothetical protein
MSKILAVLCFFASFAVLGLTFPNGLGGVLLMVFLSLVTIVILRRAGEDSSFLVNIFLIALLARILFATASQVFEITGFLGGDQLTYDDWGGRILDFWMGNATGDDVLTIRAINASPGWGMAYFTAFIYSICGKNMISAQFVCSVVGAATAPAVYICSQEIFNNRRVSQWSAVLVALFPAFIVWSSQLLKDGLIIFLLVLTMTMVLKLQKKFSYLWVMVLAVCLFGILGLRFYIFYIVGVAVAGSFIIGMGSSMKSVVRGFISLTVLGAVLTYIGALQSATTSFEKFGTMERLQASRLDNARSANSGFGDDIDVSTPMGALQALPIGFAYLMFAPFPWQISNFRQASTLPEMLVWWALFPLLIGGLWFTIKHKLRNAVPILLFTLMLTLAYSISQGNVGTAYRQRAQVQVFLFIFIAVGATLMIEKRENTKLAQEASYRRFKSLNEANTEATESHSQ